MTVLKARVGADWVTIGGAAAGVPAGGSTGLVLTKKSAADYDTQWATNQPILANSVSLQGYKADGTTAQNLIGVSATDDVSIGAGLAGTAKQILMGGNVVVPNGQWLMGTRTNGTTHILAGTHIDGVTYIGHDATGEVHVGENCAQNIMIGTSLAAGKNVYVPRLTVQGPLTLGVNYWLMGSDGKQVLTPSSDTWVRFLGNTNGLFNESAGTCQFSRDVTINGILYKGGAPYAHPDFVFEHHFTGGIERFRDAPGADSYEGLWPLARVEEFAQEHWRLPGHAARENDRVDIFRRTHDLLAELERVYLHLFEHERRLSELEER